MRKLVTSESVTEGHPDKVCDKISDAILTYILSRDRDAHVACETMVTTGTVIVTGEISSSYKLSLSEIESIVRDTLISIGYIKAEYGIDGYNCTIIPLVKSQSPDIAQGVNLGDGEIGAGDQGMMYGYATVETQELMPAPIVFAHRLTKKLAEVRKMNRLPYLRPDGKSQVTVEYDGDEIKRIDTVLISTQHDPDSNYFMDMDKDVLHCVVYEGLGDYSKLIDENTKYLFNPTGRFVIGGPQGDAGLTGRKIMVDTYGGVGKSGGGALSGKDFTKVDRSGCYAARYVAKNIVAAGLARKCEVQVSYAIGIPKPVSIMIDTFNTGLLEDSRLADIVNVVFDLTPRGIIDSFNLKYFDFTCVSNYGHFGRLDLDLPWERTDKVDQLSSYLS